MTLEVNVVYTITEKVNWFCFEPFSKRQRFLTLGDSFCYCGVETLRLRMPRGSRTYAGGATKHKIIFDDGTIGLLVLPSKVQDLSEYVRNTADSEKP